MARGAPVGGPQRRIRGWRVLGGEIGVRQVVCVVVLGVVSGASARGVGPAREIERAGKADHAGATEAAPASQPLAAYWPTEQLVENLIPHVVDYTARRYGLSDEQAAKFRRMTTRRWRPFIRELRPVAEPLVRQLLDAPFASEPPEPDAVKRWARRARRVLKALQGEVRAAQIELAEILTPEQKPRFEADVAEFAMVTQSIEQELLALAQWEQGEHIVPAWWDPEPNRRLQHQAHAEQLGRVLACTQPAALGLPATRRSELPEVVPLDEWDRFVERFIARYKLDETQQTSARSILRELKERALTYRQAHEEEYAAVDRRLAAAKKGDLERLDPLRCRRELDKPIDEMFDELRARLEGLLTSAQRALGESDRR